MCLFLGDSAYKSPSQQRINYAACERDSKWSERDRERERLNEIVRVLFHKFRTHFSIVKTNLPNVAFIRYEIRACSTWKSSTFSSSSRATSSSSSFHTHTHSLVQLQQLVQLSSPGCATHEPQLETWDVNMTLIRGERWGGGVSMRWETKCKCHFCGHSNE